MISIGLINLEKKLEIELVGASVLSQVGSIDQDLVLIGNGSLNNIINCIGLQEGVISSRWLPLGNLTNYKKGDEGSLVDIIIGGEEKFLRSIKTPEIKSVSNLKGIYSHFIVGKNLNSFLKNNPFVKNWTYFEIEEDSSDDEFSNQINLNGKHYRGFNKYEKNHQNDLEINLSYFNGCKKIANEILENEIDLEKTIIYAPLRGAKPMVSLVTEFLKEKNNIIPKVIYPVTSSFVKYPINQTFFSKNGKTPVSGRYSNILELRRLKYHLEDYKNIIYIDEIVSGGMMTGHVKELIGEKEQHLFDDKHNGLLDHGILRDLVESNEINLYVYGLSDAEGTRFRKENKQRILGFEEKNLLTFKEFPIKNLITEDQRYLLGIHYLDYKYGPALVPMINEGDYYLDKLNFEGDFIKYKENGFK